MKTVLIVVSEDIHLLHALQQLVRNVLSELRKYQAKVLVASSAEEAINSIQQQTVDVLLKTYLRHKVDTARNRYLQSAEAARP
jgi:CheY-like chemotaxis protein